MLNELNIRDFVIIEELSLRFGPGLHVFTGETGAGKSIIIDAVSMLLGGRADSGLIRSETDMTTIEGIFLLSPTERAAIDPVLQRDELQHEEPGVLILCREIRRSGYNVCRVNGRAVRLGVLEEIGRHLIDIHGQSEHLSLLHERAHLGFLDRYAGLADERERLQAVVRQLRAVRRELDDLIHNDREASRRADLLRYQIDEIEAAHLEPGEDTTLVQERNRLANAEKLTEICTQTLILLADGQDEQPPALDLVGESVRALANLARIDPQMEAQSQQAQEIEIQLDDLTSALRDYQDEVEFSPTRLNDVEERLELIRRLQRKYGDSIEDVLDFCEQAGAELTQIENSEERIVALRTREQALLVQIGQLGSALSARRRTAGQRLAEVVETELDELKMEQARFDVALRWVEDAQGAIVEETPSESGLAPGRYAFDATGMDRVAFVIAPNVGEPLKPLARVASGGETSRLMLALKTALSRADQIPTLIFDEIDQGIGGRVGGTVGEKLYNLSHSDKQMGRQVFCVTHLPQLAGYADAHMRVIKKVQQGRTRTTVEPVEGDARIAELAQMLGGETETTRQIAVELLSQRAS
jgi:DNA repair protein RecN (Recombination protein N)